MQPSVTRSLAGSHPRSRAKGLQRANVTCYGTSSTSAQDRPSGTSIGIALIGTVLFGSLHIVPGPAAVARAVSHSAQPALLANLGLMTLALILVLALPRDIRASPGSRRSEGARRARA